MGELEHMFGVQYPIQLKGKKRIFGFDMPLLIPIDSFLLKKKKILFIPKV